MRLEIGLALVATLAAHSVAMACACCDRGSTREILGWSESGRSAIVRFETQACENHVALEVWRQGRNAPATCFDLFSDDPNASVECSAIIDGAYETTPRPSRRTRAYPAAVQQLHPADIRAHAWRTRLVDDEETYARPVELQVEVRVRGEWTRVFEGRFYTGRPERYDIPMAFQYVELPLEVSVWPNPQGDRALLAVSGHNVAPGMGEWPTTLHWVHLPEGTSTRRVRATTEPVAAITEHRVGFPRRVRAARTVVQHAEQAVDENNLSGAEHLYAMALVANPTLTDAMLGLAAIRVRRARSDGLGLLRRALQHDPVGVLRTESDADFGALQGVPAYWILLDVAARLSAEHAREAAAGEPARRR